MVEGMQGQGLGRVDRGQQHVSPDRRAVKESKDLALTNQQYQAAIESVVALQSQMAAVATKIQRLTESLKATVTPAQHQAIASELAIAGDELRLLKDQLGRASAGATFAAERKPVQLRASDSRSDAMVKFSVAVLLGVVGVIFWRMLRRLARRF